MHPVLLLMQFEFAGALFPASLRVFRVFRGLGSCEDHGSHGIRKMALTTNTKSRGITGDS